MFGCIQNESNDEWEKCTDDLTSYPLVYAVKHIDNKTRITSSSGGVFTALTDYFLRYGNAVVAAIYNYESHNAEFQMILHKEQREKAKGSKYMQSKPGDIYCSSLNWLNANPSRELLFVGMGCQAEGFRRFAEASGVRDRVIIVDIICHGSPSPKLWREYAARLESKYSGKMTELSFKDKRKGWTRPTPRAMIREKEIFLHDYVKVFYNRCAMRPSCHSCPFATINRATDMTIGDFWHIEKTMPEFFDELGISLCLINTLRGAELFNYIKEELDYRQSNTKDCWQANLEKPTLVSENREQFWEEYQSKGIDYIMKKHGKDSLQMKINRKIMKMIRGGIVN